MKHMPEKKTLPPLTLSCHNIDNEVKLNKVKHFFFFLFKVNTSILLPS